MTQDPKNQEKNDELRTQKEHAKALGIPIEKVGDVPGRINATTLRKIHEEFLRHDRIGKKDTSDPYYRLLRMAQKGVFQFKDKGEGFLKLAQGLSDKNKRDFIVRKIIEPYEGKTKFPDSIEKKLISKLDEIDISTAVAETAKSSETRSDQTFTNIQIKDLVEKTSKIEKGHWEAMQMPEGSNEKMAAYYRKVAELAEESNQLVRKRDRVTKDMRRVGLSDEEKAKMQEEVERLDEEIGNLDDRINDQALENQETIRGIEEVCVLSLLRARELKRVEESLGIPINTTDKLYGLSRDGEEEITITNIYFDKPQETDEEAGIVIIEFIDKKNGATYTLNEEGFVYKVEQNNFQEKISETGRLNERIFENTLYKGVAEGQKYVRDIPITEDNGVLYELGVRPEREEFVIKKIDEEKGEITIEPSTKLFPKNKDSFYRNTLTFGEFARIAKQGKFNRDLYSLSDEEYFEVLRQDANSPKTQFPSGEEGKIEAKAPDPTEIIPTKEEEPKAAVFSLNQVQKGRRVPIKISLAKMEDAA